MWEMENVWTKNTVEGFFFLTFSIKNDLHFNLSQKFQIYGNSSLFAECNNCFLKIFIFHAVLISLPNKFERRKVEKFIRYVSYYVFIKSSIRLKLKYEKTTKNCNFFFLPKYKDINSCYFDLSDLHTSTASIRNMHEVHTYVWSIQGHMEDIKAQ